MSSFLHLRLLTSECPFIGGQCRKVLKNGMLSGLCSGAQVKDPSPVICCPNRLYAEGYKVLEAVVADAFGGGVPLLTDDPLVLPQDSDAVIPFGHGIGKELQIQHRSSKFSFDWILALVSPQAVLKEFVAVEIQTIDTSGSYHLQSWAVQKEAGSARVKDFPEPDPKQSSFNFENVNKRIIPQIISKGHLLRMEELCKKGLYFICPSPVMARIENRLGGALQGYPASSGTVTFHAYDLDLKSGVVPYPLQLTKSVTTTIDQVYLAFSGPKDMPEPNSYTKVVKGAVAERVGGKRQVAEEDSSQSDLFANGD